MLKNQKGDRGDFKLIAGGKLMVYNFSVSVHLFPELLLWLLSYAQLIHTKSCAFVYF